MLSTVSEYSVRSKHLDVNTPEERVLVAAKGVGISNYLRISVLRMDTNGSYWVELSILHYSYGLEVTYFPDWA